MPVKIRLQPWMAEGVQQVSLQRHGAMPRWITHHRPTRQVEVAVPVTGVTIRRLVIGAVTTRAVPDHNVFETHGQGTLEQVAL